MAPSSVRKAKRAADDPISLRVKYLYDAAKACETSSPNLAAHLGREALKTARDAPRFLTRECLHSLCPKCGYPWEFPSKERFELKPLTSRTHKKEQPARSSGARPNAVSLSACRLCGWTRTTTVHVGKPQVVGRETPTSPPRTQVHVSEEQGVLGGCAAQLPAEQSAATAIGSSCIEDAPAGGSMGDAMDTSTALGKGDAQTGRGECAAQMPAEQSAAAADGSSSLSDAPVGGLMRSCQHTMDPGNALCQSDVQSSAAEVRDLVSQPLLVEQASSHGGGVEDDHHRACQLEHEQGSLIVEPSEQQGTACKVQRIVGVEISSPGPSTDSLPAEASPSIQQGSGGPADGEGAERKSDPTQGTAAAAPSGKQAGIWGQVAHLMDPELPIAQAMRRAAEQLDSSNAGASMAPMWARKARKGKGQAYRWVRAGRQWRRHAV